MGRHRSEAERERIRDRVAELILSENLSNAQLKARGFPLALIQEVRKRLKRRSPRPGEELLGEADMADAKPPYQSRQFIRTNGEGDDGGSS